MGAEKGKDAKEPVWRKVRYAPESGPAPLPWAILPLHPQVVVPSVPRPAGWSLSRVPLRPKDPFRWWLIEDILSSKPEGELSASIRFRRWGGPELPTHIHPAHSPCADPPEEERLELGVGLPGRAGVQIRPGHVTDLARGFFEDPQGRGGLEEEINQHALQLAQMIKVGRPGAEGGRPQNHARC